MQQKHTMEPWQAVEVVRFPSGAKAVQLIGPGASGAALMVQHDGSPEGDANAARAVACVNALAGLDPAGLAGAVVALEAVRDTGGPTENMRHADALDLIDDLRRIARLALAALRGKGG